VDGVAEPADEIYSDGQFVDEEVNGGDEDDFRAGENDDY